MTTTQATIPTIPTTLELVERARRAAALRRGPARPDCRGRLRHCQQPDHRRGVFEVPAADRRRRRGRDPAAHAAFLAWRTVPAPVAGRAGQAPRRAADRAQGRSRRPGQHRGRQDPLRGARRGPGDDRHLRLRRRAVPPARRPHHAVRAAGAPADGDLAPARRGRGHLARSTSRPRCGPGTRRSRSSAATPWCGSRPRRPRWSRWRARALLDRAAARRRRARRTSTVLVSTDAAGAQPLRRQPAGRRWSARPARSGWARDRAAGRRALRPRASWSSAATTPRSSRRRPTSSSPCAASSSPPRAPPGQRCTTHAPADRARVRRRRSSSSGWPPSTAGCAIGDPFEPTARSSAR